MQKMRRTGASRIVVANHHDNKTSVLLREVATLRAFQVHLSRKNASTGVRVYLVAADSTHRSAQY